MALDEKLMEILRNHTGDVEKRNWAPIIADAYLQGGTEYVCGLKNLIITDDYFKKLFNDAIEKIIADLLRAALS